MARPVAVLDANGLYPARVRDLILRLACHYRVLFTERILDECFSNLSGLADHVRSDGTSPNECQALPGTEGTAWPVG